MALRCVRAVELIVMLVCGLWSCSLKLADGSIWWYVEGEYSTLFIVVCLTKRQGRWVCTCRGGVIMGYVFLLIIVFLFMLSAFFSGSETALMASNRYKAQHLATKGNLAATRLHSIHQKPEDMLGMILIGNTFANILLSSLLTWLTMDYFGPAWVFLMTCVLTLCVLVFAELLPKTLAAYHADRLAMLLGGVLNGLLWLLYPVVKLVNAFVGYLLARAGVRLKSGALQALTHEELKGIIKSQRISLKHEPGNFQQMLVGVLDLAGMTVNDVMVNRQDMMAVDVGLTQTKMLDAFAKSQRVSHVVYDGSIARILGVVKVSSVLQLLHANRFNKQALLNELEPCRFVPEGTSLQTQLKSFQKDKYQIAVVVDEYGDVTGSVNIEDIIEEIIGEFSLHEQVTVGKLKRNLDGSYLLSGKLPVRDVNKMLGLAIPESGPHTLSGWVIEYLACIPDGPLCLRYENVCLEVMQLSGNKIHSLRLWTTDKAVK